jgi:hypothetical protein
MIMDMRPDEDATVVRYGVRRLLGALPLVVGYVAVGALGVALARLAVRTDPPGLFWIPISLCLAVGAGGVGLFVSRWRARHWITAFDPTGFWWMRGGEIALIRWDSLAGAGVHWARSGKNFVFTVELCPKDEIDRDDPLLWKFVRDADPIRPGLPRLRYRIDVTYFQKAYEKAFQQWAPDLWLGREEQPYSYLGQPDSDGHRDRLAGRTGTAEGGMRDPLVFAAVEIGDSVVVHRSGVVVRRRLAVASVMVAACAGAVWGLVPERGHGAGAVMRDGLAAVLVLLTGWALVTIARGVGRIWNRRVTMDAAGVHFSRHGQSATVPWESLAGVGVHGAPPLYTLELCPKGEIDRDTPLLEMNVADSEPLRPGEPRLRHRVSIWPAGTRHAVAAGCLRWVPDLWFGGERVASIGWGVPDSKDHRRRTGETADAGGHPGAVTKSISSSTRPSSSGSRSL